MCITQYSKNIVDDLKRLEFIYGNAKRHFVIGGESLKRGWCLFEFSVSNVEQLIFEMVSVSLADTEFSDKISYISSPTKCWAKNVNGDDVYKQLLKDCSYDYMQFSFDSDKEYVQKKITSKWTVEDFNKNLHGNVPWFEHREFFPNIFSMKTVNFSFRLFLVIFMGVTS